MWKINDSALEAKHHNTFVVIKYCECLVLIWSVMMH